MDGATEGHQKELYRCIRFVLLTRTKRLKLKPVVQTDIEVKAVCDSDYAGDPDNRKNVSGYIVYVNECPVSWRSRQQRIVSLSSCESEYYAMTEAAQELLYLFQLFEFLQVPVKKPMTIKCDNQGAIFLAKNESSTRTKHIDVRYHFIRDLVDSKMIELEYVGTKENVADMLTKNLPTQQFEKLTNELFEEETV